MTNPAFHSWRLNWASLNPMLLLTDNRNKWSMAELCLCASLSHSCSYTEIQLLSFENFELSCRKLYDCLKFLRYSKHCIFLSVIQFLDSELPELYFLGFWGTLFTRARWHSRKIPWFHRSQTPEHTVQTSSNLHYRLQKLICHWSRFLDVLLLMNGKRIPTEYLFWWVGAQDPDVKRNKQKELHCLKGLESILDASMRHV